MSKCAAIGVVTGIGIAVFATATQEVQSEPKGPAPVPGAGTGEMCETWRDYLYFVETETFIEWVGLPYKVCWGSEGPPQVPDIPDNISHGYGGGRRKKPTCSDCSSIKTSCEQRADAYFSNCLETHEWRSSKRCTLQGIGCNGKDIGCKWLEFDTSVEGEKPNITRVCLSDSTVLKCEERCREGWPAESTDTGGSITLDFGALGLGAGGSTTVTYPAGTGYVQKCMAASDAIVNEKCIPQNVACEEAAGGCPTFAPLITN